MKFSFSLVAAAVLLSVAVCNASITLRQVEPPLMSSPAGWTDIGAAQPTDSLSVIIALTHRDTGAVNRIFKTVSDPFHQKYGQHLSLKQMDEHLTLQDASVVDSVHAWATEAEVVFEVSLSGDMMRAEAPVAVMSELLSAEFRVYQHDVSGITVIRTLSYQLPSHLAESIDFVSPTIHFPKVSSPRRHTRKTTGARASVAGARDQRSPDAGGVTPQVIKERYNITDVGMAPNNLQAVNQFLGQYYSPADLLSFQKKFNLPEMPVANETGPNQPGRPGGEASLDIQYIMGTAVNVSTWFISTAGNDNGGQEPFIEWLYALNNLTTIPYVLSVSYGDDEVSITPSYLSRVEVEFQKLGARGSSVLYASGDSGVSCIKCKEFGPDWPASSPSVTTVGGTFMNGRQEEAVSFSGGGFSNYFAQPSYQSSAVAHYLNNAPDLPEASFYNATSRAYPDISAFATDFEVVIGGGIEPLDGTSCAAPTASGIISLLNDQRLLAGGSPLGFLNPWLYGVAANATNALYDVTQGRNGDGCCKGFPAYTGYDPISGLGTLNYEVLKTLL